MHDTLISPQVARELTSLAYFLVAGLAGYCAWRTQPPVPGVPSSYNLYKKSAYCLLAFGINKMYDIQLWIWHTARTLFRTLDLYNDRWIVQAALVAFLILAGMVILYHHGRTKSPRHADTPIVLALGLIITLICISTLSFHYVDMLFGSRVVGFKLYWLLEWSAIGLAALALQRSFSKTLRVAPTNPDLAPTVAPAKSASHPKGHR